MPLVPGITLTLFDSSGNIVATTSPNQSGFYFFDDLLLGTYRLRASAPGYISQEFDIVLDADNVFLNDITLVAISPPPPPFSPTVPTVPVNRFGQLFSPFFSFNSGRFNSPIYINIVNTASSRNSSQIHSSSSR